MRNIKMKNVHEWMEPATARLQRSKVESNKKECLRNKSKNGRGKASVGGIEYTTKI